MPLTNARYTTAIDMWSFGCIVAELYIGLPLFPGASEYDVLCRMIEILGLVLPPENLYLGFKFNLVIFVGESLIELY